MMTPNRITFVNPVGVIGGAERVLLLALSTLRTHSPDTPVTLLLLGSGPLEQAAAQLGVTVRVVPLPISLAQSGDSQQRGESRLKRLMSLTTLATRIPAGLGWLVRFRRELVRTQPSLIVSNGVKAHLVLAATRLPRVRVVWYLHDFYSERPTLARLLPLAARRVRHGIAISDAVKRDVFQVIPRLPTTVVRNAVDTERFAPGAGEPERLDTLAGLPLSPAGTVRTGLIATYASWKGHGVYLEALARVPGVMGVIVGGPIYATAGSQVSEAELRTRIAELGLTDRVGLVPFQADPAWITRTLDIVIHASTRPEPFGLTIAEAMSSGRAVIVAKAGGAAEIVTEGVTALTHTPGDAVQLAAAIQQLATNANKRTELGLAARAYALKEFTPARYARELLAVLNDVRLAR